jgi:diamine N-acetyltransferase
MMGLPDFPDHPIPSYEEFLDDYAPHFFDGSKPRSGQSFIIYVNGTRCGQINFDTDPRLPDIAELDIWLVAKKFTGKGIGSDAIETLSRYLLNELNFEALIIAPSRRNIRAIKAYQKAGFVFTDEVTTPAPDYTDSVTLIKQKKTTA